MKWQGKLRTSIVSLSLAIALAFASLGAGLLESLTRLDALAHDEAKASALLQRASELENLAILTNRAPSSQQNWARADALFQTLRGDVSADDPNDEGMMARTQTAYMAMKRDLSPVAAGADEASFLDAMRAFRDAHLRDVQEMAQQGEGLDRASKRWALALGLFSFLTLALALQELWNRVFSPVVALSRAAKAFGEGDLSVRARLSSRDEIGALGATFDAMAQGIQERENERLRLVAGLAHDLKNPLVVVGGAAHLLRERRDALSEELQDEWLGKIEKSARRMEELISDLADSVQSQTSTLQLSLGPCDLAASCCNALDECKAAFSDHRFEFEGPEQFPMMADGHRIERALVNLLSNAAKYSPPDSLVQLHLRAGKGRAEVEVRDEGEGIAPDDLKRLFQPFVRLERTRTKAEGTGLGLVSVSKIVRAHGGETTVRSEVGRGSTFGFWLPFGK